MMCPCQGATGREPKAFSGCFRTSAATALRGAIERGAVPATDVLRTVQRSEVMDTRRVRRAIGGLLLATGTPSREDVARADEGMRALGWPPITAADMVSESPERLAPQIPEEPRPGLLQLLYHLAGDEPIRRRLADAYAGLWGAVGAPSGASPDRGSPVARWLIGQLPRHHDGGASEEAAMIEPGPYRGGDVAPPQLAPVART